MKDRYLCVWLVAATLEEATDTSNWEKLIELIQTAFKYRWISE